MQVIYLLKVAFLPARAEKTRPTPFCTMEKRRRWKIFPRAGGKRRWRFCALTCVGSRALGTEHMPATDRLAGFLICGNGNGPAASRASAPSPLCMQTSACPCGANVDRGGLLCPAEQRGMGAAVLHWQGQCELAWTDPLLPARVRLEALAHLRCALCGRGFFRPPSRQVRRPDLHARAQSWKISPPALPPCAPAWGVLACEEDLRAQQFFPFEADWRIWRHRLSPART